jgi:uncharacterized YigZ family protein
MRTLAAPGRIEIEIRRSRFVAHAARVDDIDATLAFFASVADPAATHNCWAWKIDHQYRFNDDGEPASTAGKPILTAIEGKGVDHAMVVVTRYFGGIKLGAGGLARAYSGSAARCIDHAGTVEIHTRMECEIAAGFGWTGEVYAALEACQARKLQEAFEADGIRIRASVTEARFGDLCTALRDATRGDARIRKLA